MSITKIRVAIVDDEQPARSRLKGLLAKDPEIDIVAICSDGFEAVHSIRKLAPDLVYLDVQMPEKNGFQVIEEIGADRMPSVIFVTAYDQYAIQAFDVSALDYLLKPFDEERFVAATERAKNRVKARTKAGASDEMLQLLREWKRQPNYLERIALNADGRVTLLKVEEIDWLSAEKNYVRVHKGKSSWTIRETLNNIESQLDPKRFARIHRSTIVNLDKIREIEHLFHGGYRVVMNEGTHLTISRRYRDRIPIHH